MFTTLVFLVAFTSATAIIVPDKINVVAAAKDVMYLSTTGSATTAGGSRIPQLFCLGTDCDACHIPYVYCGRSGTKKWECTMPEPLHCKSAKLILQCSDLATENANNCWMIYSIEYNYEWLWFPFIVLMFGVAMTVRATCGCVAIMMTMLAEIIEKIQSKRML